MKKTLLVAALVAGFAGMASASTVTLSGELKAEAKATVGHVSNPLVKGFGLTVEPSWEAKFALSGSEDLSNGLKAIFTIESEVKAGDYTFLNSMIAIENELRANKIATAEKEYKQAEEAAAETKKQAYEVAKGKTDAAEKAKAEKDADEAYEAAIKDKREALEKAKKENSKYESLSGYGLEVTSAYVGLQGEMGTVTFGLQEDEIYTKDKLFSDALHVEHPLIKYVGTFGGAKVALNVADFHAFAAGGVSQVTGTSGVGLVASGNFAPLSLSAQYTMSGVTGGLTLATSAGFNNVGAALQLAYTYDKMLTVAAGYGYEFDVKEAVEVPTAADPKNPTDEEKAAIQAAKDTNLARHHHRAFVAVKGMYAIDDMSDLEASAEFGYSYNVVAGLQHGFGGKVNVDYTYNMSKRTAVGVGLELVAPTFATTGDKAKSVEMVKPFSSELSVSLTHKF